LLEPEAVFTRTPRSGGWHGAGDYDMAGDLMTTAKLFPFCVEVKWREPWVPERVFRGERSPVWKWWEQACGDALKTIPFRVPMLWFRRRDIQWLVMLQKSYIDRNRMAERMLTPDFVACPHEVMTQGVGAEGAVVIYRAARFLQHDPSVFTRVRRV